MTRLKDLRVLEHTWSAHHVLGTPRHRPATVSDLVAALQAEGGEVVDTGWQKRCNSTVPTPPNDKRCMMPTGKDET